MRKAVYTLADVVHCQPSGSLPPKMFAMIGGSAAFHGPVVGPVVRSQPTVVMATPPAELEKLAKDLNPVVGYWDPLNLGNWDLWGQGSDASMGFLRHAEIKHGRVAMAAFVGFCVQSNGIKFPWAPFDAIPGDISPAAQWDMLSDAAKLQIIGFVGFLEVFSEHSYILEADGEKHYMKGGKPGYFPSLKDNFGVHPVPFNLFDPLNAFKNQSAESKAKGLLTEINNGRLAMIGIMAFVSEAKVPGSVPALKGMITAYSGEVMAPFLS